MKNQMVSVIVPIYNAEEYLERCINSILSQSYTNIEIILVDDGSIDSSPIICDNYEQKDKRIKVIHQKNSGVSVARNNGVLSANGKYITFIDSDDWIDIDAIKHMVSTIQKTQADLVEIGIEHVYETGSEVRKVENIEFLKTSDIFVWYNEYYPYLWSVWGALYLTDLVKENIRFSANMTFGEDNLFNLEYLSICNSVCIINEIGYYYNRANEISAGCKCHQNMDDYMLLVADKTISLLKNNTVSVVEQKQKFSEILSDRFYFVLLHYIRKSANISEMKVKCANAFHKYNEYKENSNLYWVRLSFSKNEFYFLKKNRINNVIQLLRLKKIILDIKSKAIGIVRKTCPIFYKKLKQIKSGNKCHIK